ncbi:MAG: PadR family transcriptional regulator, partial [Bacillota bacterium]|nr:PadR family transcriptional regulator [Bacillota bacterium]
MSNRIVRKLLLGFISIHILHHAKKEPIYGTWMIEEL